MLMWNPNALSSILYNLKLDFKENLEKTISGKIGKMV
jgi:hypothetical protein